MSLSYTKDRQTDEHGLLRKHTGFYHGNVLSYFLKGKNNKRTHIKCLNMNVRIWKVKVCTILNTYFSGQLCKVLIR